MPAELLTTLSASAMRQYDVSMEHRDNTFPFKADLYPSGGHVRRHLHRHAEHEIVFVQDSGTFLYDGAELKFEAGDVILNAGGHFHHPVFDREDNNGLVVLYFDPTLLASVPAEWAAPLVSLHRKGSGYCLLSNRPQAQRLVMEALEHFRSGEEHWQILCQGALLHLLSMFVTELANQRLTDADSQTSERLLAAVRYIDENLSDRISMQEVYRMAGMSRSSFCRHFKAHYSMAAQDYIRTARLMRAKALLGGSALGIGEIAWRCGFTSHHLFNRAFREWAGMTPSAYRSTTRH